jgi:lipopolysaccharide biosynthesis protein
MNPTTCSILFHNYYGLHENWIRFFSEKINIPFFLFYNMVEDSRYNHDDHSGLAERLNDAKTGPNLKAIILRRSPNQGKDIGGKLVLLDAYLRTRTNSEYVIFLHDKKSPYKIQNMEWKNKLFRIIEPRFIEKTLSFFSSHKHAGIVAATDSIRDEYDPVMQSFASNNRPKLEQLQKAFGINCTDHRFVAGTMFWARSSPLLDFFRHYHPLDIRRTLEKGNIMDENAGTNTHAWERLLSWLIFAQGYTIKGL